MVLLFSGYDVKFSGQAPYLPWAKIKGTYYHWDTISGPDIKGNILGVDIELTPPRSTQASALRFILWLSLKALLAIA
jgi:hypothetical protein